MSFEQLNESHEALSPEVFLDTSAHLCYLKRPVRNRIIWLVSKFRWIGSSTYSRVEYGNNILSVAAYLLDKLRAGVNVPDLIEHVNHVLPPPQFAKKTWTFSLLDVLAGTERDRTRLAQANLRRILKFGVKAVDAVSDKPLRDGTQCHWGTTGLKHNRDGSFSWKHPNCTAANKCCNVDGFFIENRELFNQIKSAIDALNPDERTDQLQAFSEVIGRALIDPTTLLNYKTGCKLLADAIISVDSKDYRSFATQNYKESQVLTPVLGQACYYVPNNPEHFVKIQISEGVVVDDGSASSETGSCGTSKPA